MIPSLSANLQSTATATSGVKGDQSQTSSQQSGGNRGFINNFAGGGSNVAAPDINGPAWQPGTAVWVLMIALIVGAVWYFRKH